MSTVRKAVIPAAGLGTRVLPATKSMPKEMLPIVDKPAIQFIVEEAVRSGITDILIITNRGKGILEDHFDRSPELEERLAMNPAKADVLKEIIDISKLANIQYVRQKETRGLGHAVACAKSFVGNEPFAVLYGDDVIMGDNPTCGQLIKAYEKYGKMCGRCERSFARRCAEILFSEGRTFGRPRLFVHRYGGKAHPRQGDVFVLHFGSLCIDLGNL